MARNQDIFTVKERIILHLDNYTTSYDQYLTPDSVTQEGIARAVGITRNAVPRAIVGLKQNALLIEKKSRVNGYDRRKKVYFLSENGRDLAKVLKERQQIISSHFFHIPKTPNFVGRVEEMKNLKQLLTSGKRVILITGDLGIGKTSYVGQYLAGLPQDRVVLWHTISETESLLSLLRSLADSLLKSGNGLLNYHLSLASELVSDKTINTLKETLKDRLLVFDCVDGVSEEMQGFLSMLSKRINEFDKVQLIIIGKNLESFLEISKIKKSASIKLHGLDKESVAKLIKESSEEDIEKIYEITKGHPLFLNIFQSKPVSCIDIRSYLETILWEDLSEAERKVMQLLSVYSRPVHLNFILREKGIDYQDIINLVRNGIVQEYEEQVFSSHKILKDYFYSTITPAKKISLHKKAAKLLMKQGEPVLSLNALQHMIMAGNHQKCAQAIIEYGFKLTRNGYGEEVGDLITKLEGTDVGDLWVELLLLRGYIWKLNGMWEKALVDYNAALKFFKKAKMKDRQAETKEKIGGIFYEKGMFEKAMDEFKMALNLLENERTSIGARIYEGFGTVHLRRGEIEEAEKVIGIALEIIEEISDEKLTTAIYNTLGNLHEMKQNWEEAKRWYEKCLETLKDYDEHMTIIIYNNLANTYFGMIDVKKALYYWERAREKAENIKHLNVMYMYSNLGFGYYTIGDWKKAIYYSHKALEISEYVGKDIITSSSRSILGLIALHRGSKNDWLENFESALILRVKLRDKKGQVYSNNDLAIAYMIQNKLAKATYHAEKARDISEKMNSKEEMIKSYLNLAKIYAINGKITDSKEYLKSALSQARQAEHKVLMAIVYREIAVVSALEEEYFVSEHYLKDSIEILEKANIPFELGQSLFEYGRVVKKAKIDDPEKYWQRSRKIFQSLGLPEVPPILKVYG